MLSVSVLRDKFLAKGGAGVYNGGIEKERRQSMSIELERKYRCAPSVQEQLLRAFGGEFETVHMRTTYYDTPDGALSRRRWTLRRRMEGERSVCTLKTPAGAMSRQEYEVEALSLPEALGELAALSGQPELTELADRLIPVCGASFRRRLQQVSTPEFTAELALDLGMLTAGQEKTPLAELEVELKQGDAEAMLRWGSALAAQWGLQPEKRSKYARARALAEGGSHG